MEKRYERAFPVMDEAAQQLLAARCVLIVGCGGLGGHLLESMARLGVGELRCADGDVFDETNLNRQLLCTEDNIGRSKASAAAERVRAVNSSVKVSAFDEPFSEKNADFLTAGCDLVLDALDNIPARLLLEDVCARRGIPLVHGAIQGTGIQVAVCPPGSGLLHRLYPSSSREDRKCSLPFTPPFCAAVQAAEAAKLLLGQSAPLTGRLLVADLTDMSWDVLSLL